MSIEQNCERIIKQVCSSNLDYQMNQTPYSIYFSIRKKFIRGFEPFSAENSDCSKTTQNELQLIDVKKEYEKLYNFYQTSLANEILLKSEISRL